MHNLSFSWPYAAVLFLVPLAFYFLPSRQSHAQLYLKSYLATVIEKIAPKKLVVHPQRSFHLGPALLWSLMVIALMRPQWVGHAMDIPRSGRSIMVVLDISESMEAQDMTEGTKPTERINVAKSVLVDFIDHRRGDGIGLVVFGSEPFLHAPLSFDHETIKRFLLDSQVGFAGPKTAIGDAIGLAVKKLREQPAGQHLIVLLTDGQNNAGKLDPLMAAQIVQKQGIKIYIVGLGASEMVVEGFFGRSLVNPSRDLEEAEPTLKQMAEMTGGSYFRAKDAQALLQAYKQIDALEPVILDSHTIIPKKEIFYWPLAALAMLMLVQLICYRVIRGRSS